jgi:hypothetical protein
VSLATDAGTVGTIAGLIVSRTVRVTGSTLPVGSSVTAASGTTLTLTYPFTVTVPAGQTNDLLEWSFGDAPNERQWPISRVVAIGAFTLNLMDFDGSAVNINGSAVTGVNEMELSLTRTLAGTTGALIGWSRGFTP